MQGAFTEQVCRTMATLNERPIIFPLSNPVRLSECIFSDAVEWTDGRVVFASGSPFPEYQYKGKTHYPGQGNNMYVFPGIGLGAILSRASSVTDKMIETASLALSDSLTSEERSMELVYPRIERIREISAQIAVRVIRAAQREVRDQSLTSRRKIIDGCIALQGVDRSVALRDKSDAEILEFSKKSMWMPQL